MKNESLLRERLNNTSDSDRNLWMFHNIKSDHKLIKWI